MLTRDHVIPKSRGGSTGYDNILPACYKCNQHKAGAYIVEKIPRQEELYIQRAKLIDQLSNRCEERT